MKSRGRYVVATNVIVSALLFEHSKPVRALLIALEAGSLLMSVEIVQELTEVLRREKFDRYVQRKIREEFLKALIQQSEIVLITDRINECRDPKDDKVLELAVSGGASCIISGDVDLLVMNPFRSIPIMTAEQFLLWVLHQ